MRRSEDSVCNLPPRVKAAFDFLHHARMITEQVDAAIPMRSLTSLERSVETAALRAIQQYLLGEMEFAEEPQAGSAPGQDDPPGEVADAPA